MMPVIVDGPCGQPLQGLAELLAACPTFQAKVEAPTAIGALAKIHIGKVDFTKDPKPTRPYAIIGDDDLCSWEMDRYFKCAGQVVLTLEFFSDVNYDPDSDDALKDYITAIGKIFVEMFERSNTPGPAGTHYWNAVKVTRLIAPALCDERQHDGDNEPGELYFESSFLVDWV